MTTFNKQQLEEQLTDLVAISHHRKPGQVTHKIAEIVEMVMKQNNEAITQAIQEVEDWAESKTWVYVSSYDTDENRASDVLGDLKDFLQTLKK